MELNKKEIAAMNVRLVHNSPYDNPEDLIEPPYYRDENGLIHFTSTEAEMASYVFLRAQNKFYQPLTGTYMSITAYDLDFGAELPRKAGKASVYAKAELNVQSVEDTMYYPPAKPGAIFTVNGVRYVNSMIPGGIPEVPEDWNDHDAWIIVCEHITNLLNNEDAKVLIDWLAHNVQYPGKKILWAPIVVGTQGDGKTTILKMLGAVMGPTNVKHVSPEALDSAFNSYAHGAAVVGFEEVRIIGKSRHDILNKVKPLISNSVVEVVAKSKDGKQVLNVTNYIALTNHEDALVLDEHDRRWGVFRTKFENRAQVMEKLDDAYWDRLHRAIEDHAGVIRGFLLSVDLKDFNPHRGPAMTEAKRKMIQSSMSSAAVEIESVIDTANGVTSKAIANSELARVMREAGYQMPKGRGLSSAMRDLGYENLRNPISYNESRTRVWYRKASVDGTPSTSWIKEALMLSDYETGDFDGFTSEDDFDSEIF